MRYRRQRRPAGSAAKQSVLADRAGQDSDPQGQREPGGTANGEAGQAAERCHLFDEFDTPKAGTAYYDEEPAAEGRQRRKRRGLPGADEQLGEEVERYFH